MNRRQDAIVFLIKLRLEPYWDSSNDQVLFRKISNSGGNYNVTRQRIERGWPGLIEVLDLHSKENSDSVRREVRGGI